MKKPGLKSYPGLVLTGLWATGPGVKNGSGLALCS